MTSRHFIALAGCFALTLASAAAQDAAKDFPNRSIKIVVPFPAGGPSDVLARLIGQKMTEDWGQPVVIENRVGANTVIGAQAVKQAPADGYTLLMAIDSTLTMNQYLYRTPPYDPINDFVPITLVAKTMILLMVNSVSEIKTTNELVAKAKAQPGKTQLRRRHDLQQAARLPSQQSRRHQHRSGPLQRQRRGHPGPFDQERRLHPRWHLGRGIADPERAVPVLAKFDDRPLPLAPNVPVVQLAVPNLDQITVWLGLVAPKGNATRNRRKAPG